MAIAALQDRTIEIAAAEPGLYEETLAALAEALLTVAPRVDLESGRASIATAGALDAPLHRDDNPSLPLGAGQVYVFVEVPPRTRGQGFGHQLLAVLRRQGLHGRVGIADDRFTAQVAATLRPAGRDCPEAAAVTVVPRGGAAAYLAPLRLNVLPIEEHVLDVLATLGIHTIGDFTALPPPTVRAPWTEIDLQALARGDGPTSFRSYQPNLQAVEQLTLPRPMTRREPLSFLLRSVCDRLGERLSGRERAAAALRLSLRAADGREHQVRVELQHASSTGSALRDALCSVLPETLPLPAVELTVTVTVEVCPAQEAPCELFPAVAGTLIDPVERAIARLDALRFDPAAGSATDRRENRGASADRPEQQLAGARTQRRGLSRRPLRKIERRPDARHRGLEPN